MGVCTSKRQSVDEVTWENTTPYIPTVTEGIVVKIYDGDTITIGGRVSGDPKLYRFSVRLLGIDCPEIKSHVPFEKAHAIEGREHLKNMIFGKKVTLSDVSTEKFGRLLANVHFESLIINEYMLNKKYAIKYDGGTKNKYFDWQAYAKS